MSLRAESEASRPEDTSRSEAERKVQSSKLEGKKECFNKGYGQVVFINPIYSIFN